MDKRASQIGFQNREEEVGGAFTPTPNQETICTWYVLAQEKLIFSKGVSSGTLTKLQGRPHAQQ